MSSLVLHVLAGLGRSGAESMLLASRQDFLDRGYDSDVLSTGATAGPMVGAFESAGFGVHHVPFAKTPFFFFRVYRLMRRYEVIHLHTERANFWFGLAALATRPRRVVRTVHSVFSFEGALRRRRGLQRRLLHRLGVVHIACGPTVQRNEQERFDLSTRLAPSWYDSRTFFPPAESERSHARNALGIADEQTALVTTGTCAAVKNHGALLEALARLPSNDRPVYLHVGIEEQGHPERRLAEKLGVADSVRFLGPVPDLPPVFAASDLFAMPSLYEGFSVAALEALATGLPALLTDVGGLSDLRNFYLGLSYADPTTDSLAEALERLIAESREERRARSARYAAVTRNVFGLDVGVERYVAIYRGSAADADARLAAEQVALREEE